MHERLSYFVYSLGLTDKQYRRKFEISNIQVQGVENKTETHRSLQKKGLKINSLQGPVQGTAVR